MLVTSKFTESLLLELGQGDLIWKNLDVDAKKLIALLDDALNNFMMIQSHKEMKSTVSAISEDNSTLNILNA